MTRLGREASELSNFYAQGDDDIFSHPDLTALAEVIGFVIPCYRIDKIYKKTYKYV
jgi:hypothetical protein